MHREGSAEALHNISLRDITAAGQRLQLSRQRSVPSHRMAAGSGGSAAARATPAGHGHGFFGGLYHSTRMTSSREEKMLRSSQYYI